MEEAIVLYPSPPIGHLISMVELGKLLLTQKPSLSIHILITSVPYDSGSTAPYIANVAATIPSIKFHHLPTVTLPSTKTTNYEELTFEVLRLSNPHVREQLLSISKNYTIHGLVVDFFCCAALNVAKELNIPGYHFSTSGAGIVVNTFESLEARAVKTLSEGLCVPNNRTPPIYCIGPLIATEGPKDDAGTRNGTTLECLTWLDSQPVGSVVFLCFGSLGLFSKEQLREIAFGLERSGHRFLWVVRNPPSDNKSVALSAHPNIDLDSLLPEEQRLNRIFLVEEMKLALPMNESDDGFVSSAEVEKRVLGLMESEEGKLIRERTIAMKIAAQAALNEGGSSRVALSQLVESWKHK
ncbi:hypothetical protein D5086_008313 [Populus alba]|uniref:Uncharacterized protein n=1 Tax=Populus alba TaxID=43335 RepID=A0ACC4CGQ6_POPAL